jgi:uncharacterized cupin superfamily protein
MTARLRPPAIDPESLPVRIGSSYPKQFKEPVAARRKRALGDPVGLTQFGVNLVELPPGCWSSQRHWHSQEDEFVYVPKGEVTLVTDEGEQLLKAASAAGFAAGKPNGHHLVNRSADIARYLEIGSRAAADECRYPDVDLFAGRDAKGDFFADKKGKRY